MMWNPTRPQLRVDACSPWLLLLPRLASSWLSTFIAKVRMKDIKLRVLLHSRAHQHKDSSKPHPTELSTLKTNPSTTLRHSHTQAQNQTKHQACPAPTPPSPHTRASGPGRSRTATTARRCGLGILSLCPGKVSSLLHHPPPLPSHSSYSFFTEVGVKRWYNE